MNEQEAREAIGPFLLSLIQIIGKAKDPEIPELDRPAVIIIQRENFPIIEALFEEVARLWHVEELHKKYKAEQRRKEKHRNQKPLTGDEAEETTDRIQNKIYAYFDFLSEEIDKLGLNSEESHLLFQQKAEELQNYLIRGTTEWVERNYPGASKD